MPKKKRSKKKGKQRRREPFRVLDVGHNGHGYAAQLFPHAQVVTLDAPGKDADICVDLTSEEFRALEVAPFDAIIMFHVLEHIPIGQVQSVGTKLASMLKDGGALYVTVPSIEWIAEEIIAESNNRAVPWALFGGQRDDWDFHKSGFTLPALRAWMTLSGLVVHTAARGKFNIILNDGEVYVAEQNYVVGVKVPKEQVFVRDVVEREIK